MATQCNTVTPHPIETLLTWVRSGEIARPEIQRPFGWEAMQIGRTLDYDAFVEPRRKLMGRKMKPYFQKLCAKQP